jgi:hypothetical protein
MLGLNLTMLIVRNVNGNSKSGVIRLNKNVILHHILPKEIQFKSKDTRRVKVTRWKIYIPCYPQSENWNSYSNINADFKARVSPGTRKAIS